MTKREATKAFLKKRKDASDAEVIDGLRAQGITVTLDYLQRVRKEREFTVEWTPFARPKKCVP